MGSYVFHLNCHDPEEEATQQHANIFQLNHAKESDIVKRTEGGTYELTTRIQVEITISNKTGLVFAVLFPDRELLNLWQKFKKRERSQFKEGTNQDAR